MKHEAARGLPEIGNCIGLRCTKNNDVRAPPALVRKQPISDDIAVENVRDYSRRRPAICFSNLDREPG